jgi:hypothetical protein
MQLGPDKVKDTRHATKEPAQASEGLIPSLELGKRSEKPLPPPAPVSSRDAELPLVPRISSGFQRGPSRSFSAEEVLAAGLDPEGMAEFRLGPEGESGELQYRDSKESGWETVDYYEVVDADAKKNYDALCAFIVESTSCPPEGMKTEVLPRAPEATLPPPAPEHPPATIQVQGQDYTNLSTCGGFAYDRPQSLDELQEATHARFLVASGKHPDAGIEDFTYYHKWKGNTQEGELAAGYVREGRLLAYVRPGDNEGYIVSILVTPLYLGDGSPISIAHSKCWTRDGSLALLHEVSELMVRW